MEARSKRYLRRKLARHPFLRLLVHDVWFRRGVIGLFILLVSLGLFLPRIWTTSPPGFRPVIKVSGLDLAQAWSLKRSALAAMAAGRFDAANYAWMAALANNRADAPLIRGSLHCFLKSGDTQRYRKVAVPECMWLLQLAGTNRTDLDLVAKILTQYGHDRLVIELLESTKEELTPALEVTYLKALFQAGGTSAFSNRWAQVRANLTANEELRLYESALVAGCAPMEAASAAMKTLQAALEKPAQTTLACRLLLAANSRRLDAERCQHLLDRLKDSRNDTLLDHIGYWRVLARSGRRGEAIRLAESLPCPPASAEEVLALARAYSLLALCDQALRVFGLFAADYTESAEIWVAYASALMEARSWDQLRQVALQIRVQDAVGHHGLVAYSYYLEGRAELGLQRHFHATAAFRKIFDWDFLHPKLGLNAAKDLILLGHAEIARAVLLKLEKQLASNAEYWSVLFHAAEKLKQVDLMLLAARRTHQLRPSDPAGANNYAAALLIQRQLPGEAIRLTLRATSLSPHSAFALINHAAALLLNERVDEAFALLKSIDATKLTPTQQTLYHLDLFEACLKLRRYAEAQAVSGSIDTRNLYPPQVQWFEQARRRLPPRSRDELTLLSNGDGG